jgi:hypothetical protein
MHDIFSSDPDPIEAMLRPPSPPPDTDRLRQRVYQRTQRVLRRRRRLRQLTFGAALAASFALGLLTMRVAMRPPTTPDLPARSASKGEPQPPAMPSEEPALAHEWRAFDSDEQRGELYRQAGDRYMTEENDPQSALRCYASALDNGTEQDQAISANDNWLLMAIKDARQKEKGHAKNGG